jgi:hypothetical protein
MIMPGRGEVVYGLCGWSDPSIVACKRFYPPRCRTSIDKLSHLSRCGVFGCIEVDSSTYAIPAPADVSRWVAATPPSFVIHMKAFGLFCNGRVALQQLPATVRQTVAPPSSSSSSSVTLESLGDDGRRELWRQFNAAVAPIHGASKLGAVLFQFQLGFHDCARNRNHIQYLASMLAPGYPMAIEFRDRSWVQGDAQLAATVAFLHALRGDGGGGCALVAGDDLRSEMYPSRAAHAGSDGDHLPIVLTARACPAFAYVRVHRREGSHRVLSDTERAQWCERIEALRRETAAATASDGAAAGDTPPTSLALQGPIYFLWGTDHEDQPVINAKKMRAALGGVDSVSQRAPTGIASFFGSPSSKPTSSSSSSSSSTSSSSATATSEAAAVAAASPPPETGKRKAAITSFFLPVAKQPKHTV